MIRVKNYDYIPIIFYDVFYREEYDKTITVHGTGDTCYLSSFSTSLFKMIKNNNSVKNIIQKLIDKYDDISQKDIIKKTISSLCFMENNGILICKEDWNDMVDGVFIVDEEEYKYLSRYCLKYIDKTCNLNKESPYFLPSNDSKYYELRNLRSNCFNSYETAFCLVENGEIQATIFIGGINNGIGIVSLDGIVFENEDKLYKLFNYCLKKLQEIDCKKIKYSSAIISENLLIILSELGFKYETKLVKEYKESDVYIYSLFIE